MEIGTKYFGKIDIEQSEVIKFPHGLPGFEGYKKFVLLPVGENGMYFALQSVKETAVALIVTNPYLFCKDYAFDFDEEELDIVNPEDVSVYNVVTLRDPFEESTINLQAPIVMNTKSRLAKQVILNQTPYQTRHPLLQLSKGGEAYARP